MKAVPPATMGMYAYGREDADAVSSAATLPERSLNAA
ncbi:unannotated protein [freshwater metagenome]|uniref:Unannotated protein n=1 Tax=freshwater metagenome TaxID=449393 RepID=A0A6J7G706_9ZZZZ